jgi:predicted Fe-S protein YdhL (DUF1289 family)
VTTGRNSTRLARNLKHSAVMSKKKHQSPCIDVCKMDKTSGFCKGCLRTKQEIKDWKELTKSERRGILVTIALRKTQFSEA